MDEFQTYQPLKPHSYPLWIKIGVGFCLIILLTSLFKVPYYVKINKKIKAAEHSFNSSNYNEAQAAFKELASELPLSKHMTIRLAECLFKSTDKADHIEALNLLKPFTFDTKEWKELLGYVPIEYADYFSDDEV